MLIIIKSLTWVMESVQLQDKIDSRLEMLLNLFEKEVKPYDRLSSIFFLLTPVGVILSTLSPVPIMLYVFHTNPFAAMVSGGIVFWIIGGIVATLVVTRVAILFFDYRKHQISKLKYKPLTGVCLCDLSQLRSHLNKMEKTNFPAERLKHKRLVDYYRERIGWNGERLDSGRLVQDLL
jgi:hypothetical protein